MEAEGTQAVDHQEENIIRSANLSPKVSSTPQTLWVTVRKGTKNR